MVIYFDFLIISYEPAPLETRISQIWDLLNTEACANSGVLFPFSSCLCGLQQLHQASRVSETLMKPAASIDSMSKLITHNLICSDRVISRLCAAWSAAITLTHLGPYVEPPAWLFCQVPTSCKSKWKTAVLYVYICVYVYMYVYICIYGHTVSLLKWHTTGVVGNKDFPPKKRKKTKQ